MTNRENQLILQEVADELVLKNAPIRVTAASKPPGTKQTIQVKADESVVKFSAFEGSNLMSESVVNIKDIVSGKVTSVCIGKGYAVGVTRAE